MRRLDKRDGLLAERAERRPQEPHLPDARLLDQQVDERADWPATTGQLCRQRWIARFHGTTASPRELRSSPQRYSPRAGIHSFVQ